MNNKLFATVAVAAAGLLLAGCAGSETSSKESANQTAMTKEAWAAANTPNAETNEAVIIEGTSATPSSDDPGFIFLRTVRNPDGTMKISAEYEGSEVVPDGTAFTGSCTATGPCEVTGPDGETSKQPRTTRKKKCAQR